MIVSELMARIQAAYPGLHPEALRAFMPVFQARLGKREGPALERAALEVLATFRPKHGQPFPIPADFEAALPAPARDRPRLQPLDIAGHGQRARQLMAAWRPSAKGVPEVRRALAHIARQAAHDAAWRDDAKPVVLSQQRRAEHGPPERLSGEAWWAQISAIAARWKVATSIDEWRV